jgi:hypothetical protein
MSVSDAEDGYRQRLMEPSAVDDEVDDVGSKSLPLDAAWYDIQAMRHGLDAVPQKRHLCRAKYVYNPVSGRCQPSLSVRIQKKDIDIGNCT